MNEEQKKDIKGPEFVRLLTANQNRISAYISGLVPNFNDADDILQETTAMMWARAEDFTSGTDFAAWGVRIAYYKILDYRKKKRREGKLLFSDEMFSRIAEKAPTRVGKTNTYIEKLRECTDKLQLRDKDLLNLRYSNGLSVKKISLRINYSIRTVYYDLSRIHGLLLNCIERPE